jgi:hypothetical protein
LPSCNQSRIGPNRSAPGAEIDARRARGQGDLTLAPDAGDGPVLDHEGGAFDGAAVAGDEAFRFEQHRLRGRALNDERGSQNQRAEPYTENVVAIIDGCTDDSPAAGQPKKPWRTRKKAYIAHIAQVSPSVLLVSAADKLHNARAIAADYSDLGEELWSRFNASRDDILWYYRALLEAFDGRLIALQEAEPEESDRYDDLYRLLNRLEETIEEINLDVEISKTAALMEAEFGLLTDDETTLFESLTDVTRPGLP